MNKFIILFTGRSGSSWLEELLNQNKAIHCDSELLAVPEWDNRFGLLERFVNEQEIWKGVNKVEAHGFRFKPTIRGFAPSLNEWIIEFDWRRLGLVTNALKGATIIKLTRQDRLKQAISSIRAWELYRQKKRWQIYNNEAPIEKMHFDYWQVVDVIQWIKETELTIDSIISYLSGIYIATTYENLHIDTQTTIDFICDAIDVEPHIIRQTAIKKHTDDDLSKIVSNWEEISELSEIL